jgi:hypothetical protein
MKSHSITIKSPLSHHLAPVIGQGQGRHHGRWDLSCRVTAAFSLLAKASFHGKNGREPTGSPQKLMENLEHLQETLNFEEKRSFPVDFPLKFIPRCPQFVIKLMW